MRKVKKNLTSPSLVFQLCALYVQEWDYKVRGFVQKVQKSFLSKATCSSLCTGFKNLTSPRLCCSNFVLYAQELDYKVCDFVHKVQVLSKAIAAHLCAQGSKT